MASIFPKLKSVINYREFRAWIRDVSSAHLIESLPYNFNFGRDPRPGEQLTEQLKDCAGFLDAMVKIAHDEFKLSMDIHLLFTGQTKAFYSVASRPINRRRTCDLEGSRLNDSTLYKDLERTADYMVADFHNLLSRYATYGTVIEEAR